MRTYILLLLTVFTVSCSHAPSRLSKEDALLEYAKEADIDISDYCSILFIPLEGCGSCIRSGVDFYKANADNTSILFVFCTYQPFAYDFLRDIDNYSVIIDKKSLSMKHGIISTAPECFVKEEGIFKYHGVVDEQFNFSVLY